jgi:uncharacterized protein YjiS (DUF1127 family)
MNVELVNPVLIPRLFGHSDAAGPERRQWRPRPWAKRMRASFDEELRHRGALKELRQLDDRDLDDLDVTRADLAALARHHAKDFGPQARSAR